MRLLMLDLVEEKEIAMKSPVGRPKHMKRNESQMKYHFEIVMNKFMYQSLIKRLAKKLMTIYDFFV